MSTDDIGRSGVVAARSRLQAFLKANGISSGRLERETGIQRQMMREIRLGRDVRLSTARRILQALRKITNRDVVIEEIFDLDGLS